MAMIADEIKIHVRDDEYGEVVEILSMTLYEFLGWIADEQYKGARILPNGGRSVIVIDDEHYCVAVA